ncbi:hypothetical protein TrCOL_g11996 [Triparma columacea]|uniref:Uncharacterized protein n=1 Tax=Triparma columacea TaxID=722753 RepID=A0A9W7L7G5_9STRA|nr:hypothetical protein TrCOL_g11996 [Triparma columacea]
MMHRMEKEESAESSTSPSVSIQYQISKLCSNFDFDLSPNTALIMASAWAAGVGCGVLGFRYMQIHTGVKSAA